MQGNIILKDVVQKFGEKEVLKRHFPDDTKRRDLWTSWSIGRR